ncbi:Cell wall integrity and stress response component 4 [Lasiodiplodia hormozganensis]|uniref:Cell wall integrity and stress response component 4 n=1 Tax=Lasiodiplodia hormozganensis TaxID=869390 RepID=A0AA40D1Q5_9PEZI|nr:Cell wall integrity and stress response component 4 [Lasiodiplodia hormozganensis]
MIAHRLFSTQQLLLLLTTLTLINRVNALTQTYCSSQNTGSGNLQDTYIYQSNGHCHDECVDDYAFAIVQGKQCWCSNYAPSDQQDVSNCDTTCPGYGYEDCGNSDDDLYGYIKLDLAASGTQGASSAASTSTKASTSTTSSTSKSESSTSSSAATTSSSSSSSSEESSSSSTRTSSQVTQVTVVTVGGSVVTQTVTSAPSSEDSSSSASGGSRVSGGQIAGAVVGGLAGLALIAGGIVFFLMRMRRKQDQASHDAENGSPSTPQRNVSTLSRTGLLRSGEKDYTATLPPINTTRQSSDPSDTITPSSERRNSRPLFHDQRLNPQPFMNLDNGSHASIVSIEDNRDYTRTLNVRNPDPPERNSRDSW